MINSLAVKATGAISVSVQVEDLSDWPLTTATGTATFEGYYVVHVTKFSDTFVMTLTRQSGSETTS